MPDRLGLQEHRHRAGARVGAPVGLGGRGATDALEVLGGRLLERGRQVGVTGDAGEVDGVDVHVRGQPRADRRRGAGQDVDHATGHVGGGQHLGERHRRQRALVGRHDHHGVARDDRRGDDADQAEQAGVLRGEDGDDAGRLGGREVEERARDRVRATDDLGDLVGPAGVPDQAVDRLVERLLCPGGVEPLGLAQRLHELGTAVLHDLGDPVEDLRAVVGGPAGPAAEGLAGGDDGVAGVLARGEGGVGHERPLRVVDDVGVARLRAGERATDVELVGLADVDAGVDSSQVGLQTVAAALAAVARLLVAAEGAGRVELVERVGPHHAGAQLVGHVQDQRALLGPHAGREAVRRVVGLLDRLGRGAEGQHRQDRAEDLLAGDPVRLGDAGEERRREPEAVGGQLARRRPAAGALGLTDVAELADAGQLLGGVDRADVGVLVQRVAHAQRGHAALEALEHLVGDRLLHQQARARAADVALVEEDAVDDALDGLVDRGVVEDDVGGLAAELQGDLLVRAGDRLGDRAADVGGAGEGDLVDVGVRDQRAAGVAGAGDDVDDTRGQVGLLADLGEQQRRQRGGLGGLEHDRVAAGECGRDLPREHQQREVPRDDLAGDAQRLRVAGAEAGVLQLVGPAGVVEEVRGDGRDVDVAGLLDRLAVVDRLEDGELAAALLDDPGDAVEVLGPLAAGHPAPDLVVGPAGGLHGLVDVGVVGLGDLREHLLGGGADGLEGLAAAVDELTVDEQAVRRLDVDDAARLGGGCVREDVGRACRDHGFLCHADQSSVK